MVKYVKVHFLMMTGLAWILVTHITPCYSAGTRRVLRPCGPDKRCICTVSTIPNVTTQSIKMDCSGKQVHLSDVCKIIKRDRKIVELEISSINIINSLRKTELRGCNEVHRLQMRRCGISNISDDAFTMFTKLTVLDISGNNLQDLYTGRTTTFLKPVKSLLELNLRVLNEQYTNMILKYPDLSNVGQIEMLHVDGLCDTEFPKQYRNMTKLKTLILSGSEDIFCRIDKLTNKTFGNVINVENLYISHCMITSVEAGTFRVLPNLRRLDISLNRQLGFEPINNISYGLQFTNIDFFNYSHNVNTFGLSQVITKQDLCYLRNTSITEIALDGDRLQLFETNALLLLPQTLERIHIKDNRFTFGLYLLQIACMDNLKLLDASFQSLAHDMFRYFTESHDSKERKLNVLSDCPFLDEQHLLSISRSTPNCLYFNEIPTFPERVSLPRKIKNVTITDSNIKYFIGNISLFPSDNQIERLNFSGNTFNNLEGPFGPMSALKYADLSRIYCSKIGPHFFQDMVNIEVLDMHNNILGELLENPASAEIFKPLVKLRSLNFSHNLIRKLAPNIFACMVSLEILDLSYNSIDTWTLDTSNLRNLTYLDLRFNAIGTLPESITNQLTKMSNLSGKNFSIDLTNNSIRYACVHKQFLNWMAKYESSFVNLNGYLFIDEQGTVMKVDRFKKEVKHIDTLCYSYTVAIVLSSVGIAIFLTSIVSGMIYKNRWKLRYFLYMNKTRFSNNKSNNPLDNYKFDAFISYTDENSDFRDEIIRHLENDGDNGMTLKLCIHERDFRPGRAIAENISDAIQTSNKTIIVLSKAYLKSKWCLHEFYMARMESIYSRSGKSIMIVVMLEEVPLNNKMPLELMQWIRRESYLEYTNDVLGQVVFWDKLKESILE